MNLKENDTQSEYQKIFIEKPLAQTETEESEKNRKDSKFLFTFFVQSLICIAIIGLIVTIKYLTPDTFISVSSAINGLYEDNITLSDLNEIINKNILQNEAVSAFFNIGGTEN